MKTVVATIFIPKMFSWPTVVNRSILAQCPIWTNPT